jgi:hypothetical protein
VVSTTQPGSEAAKSSLVRALVEAWIEQNILLVISSLLRLRAARDELVADFLERPDGWRGWDYWDWRLGFYLHHDEEDIRPNS